MLSTSSSFLCYLLVLFFTIICISSHHVHIRATDVLAAVEEQKPLVTIALVADNHYDTFPAGEKAPWQPMNKWLEEQIRRTTTQTKRRYDIAKDKMLEAVDVFNRIKDPQVTFAVNLGDLVNNALMWNLKPILDAFNSINAPKFSILGNHDLRGHNDRFGKNNKTQERWMMSKLGLKEWFYEIDYAPFMFIFLDSMVMEEPESNPKRRQQLKWLKETLQKAKELQRVVILFGHISIGLQTSPFAPLLKEYPHIVGGFFGHHHKGGYVLQDGYFHTTIIQGQIETMTNAFGVLEVFRDRMELTGFGRVPTRVMKFEKKETRELLKDYPIESLGKVSKEHGYEELVEGGKHQPAAAPQKVFPKEEVLQKPPPLMLNIPAYRKPLIGIAEANPGQTRFYKNVYSKWPRREKTLAPEPVVDLSEYNTVSKNKKDPVLYQIGGAEDPRHQGKILSSMLNNNLNHHRRDQSEQQKENKKKEIDENNHHGEHDEEETDQKPKSTKQQKQIKRVAVPKNVIEDEDDTESSTLNASSKSQDKMFLMMETFLVVSCVVVIAMIGYRFRRLLFK